MMTNTIKQRSRAVVRRWSWFVGVGVLLAACGAPAAQSPASPLPSSSPPTAAASPTSDAGAAGGTMLGGQNLDEAVVQQAQRRLAQHLNLPPDAPILETGSEETWPTSALGCPAPDQMYTQVVTPGYRLVFIANNRSHEVHTNADGSQAVLCENNAPVPLPTAQ